MSLKLYRKKRDFRKTREPRGRGRTKSPSQKNQGLSFTVQEHAARRLHYDFRLEFGGSLKSWAVPKGPSLDPADRRLAVHVEDHPVEYGTFEGKIPVGSYGAGNVLLWDHGTWLPKGDPAQAYRRGKLEFELVGKKLQGGWTLVRMRTDDGGRDGDRNWLLMKRDDAQARRGKGADIVHVLRESVLSGRVMSDKSAKKPAGGSAGEAGRKGVGRESPARTRAPAVRSGRVSSVRSGRASAGHARPLSTVPEPAEDTLRLTNPDRVLFPDAGVTKRGLAEYYAVVSEWMLPHVANKPLMLMRCPGGVGKPCFMQKHVGEGASPSLMQIDIPGDDGTETFLGIRDPAGLISLVQLSVLEIHPWGARADRIEQPVVMIFDLDPDPSVSWDRVVHTAGILKTKLARLDLESFVMTTGGKGLHVTVPLVPRAEWDDVRSFSRILAQALETADPEGLTTTASKARRKGKIFIDYMRNGRGATAVAPYSTRARAGAPVATPLTWAELRAGVRPDQWSVSTMPSRLRRLRSDPWRGFHTVKQALTKARLSSAG